VTPADYDPFCITAPVDQRLPSDVSGKKFCGSDVKPEKFGLVNNLITQASHYGKLSEVFDGVDVTSPTFSAGWAPPGDFEHRARRHDNCLLIDSRRLL